MRRVLCIALVVGLAGCGQEPADLPPPPPPWTPDMQAVADGNNRFALDLYGQLKAEPGNVFFSPYSAHTALSMTAAGAKGNTRDEMVKVLHLPADPDKALAAGDLGKFYAAGRKDYELSVANAIWGQKGYPWRKEFLAVQTDRFGAGLKEADFKADPDGERKRINAWAEEQTRGKIKDLIREGMIDRLFRMVLVNAIYFKGEWAEKFDPKRTGPMPFTLTDGSKKQVPMMSREGGFRLFTEFRKDGGREPEFQVAELPYKGGELAMVILLPGKPDGLPELEKKLTADALKGWLAASTEMKDNSLSLPKFRLEKGYDLKKPLQALGMKDTFSEAAADFTGMHSGMEQLYVAFVVQKAFVDVNEEGTEAAAATAVGVRTVSLPLPFQVNRPFLFLIRDVRHGTILFLGRVTDPTV